MRNRVLFAALALTAALCPARAGTGPESLQLTAGNSVVIDYAADIGRIAASNPDVADAVAVSSREVMVNAKMPGTASVVVWSKSGLRTVFGVTVEQNLEPLRQLLKKTFPDCDIAVQSAKESLSLTGQVPNTAVSERAAALLAPFAKAVVNNLRIQAPPEKQVLLRVRFVELNRNASMSLGANLLATGLGNTQGMTSTGQFGSASPTDVRPPQGGTPSSVSSFTIADALNVFMFRPDLNLGMFVKALQNRGMLQILAEPNLIATDGKEASFLVGGEFPVPVLQGGATAGAVTILFKEFGIRLTFRPQITEHDTIRMHVRPEVSTIDLSNAVVFSGFTIPALATRRMETDIELGEGQSFVIGGLIDQRVTESLSKIPGLANIPLLGALFKSRSEQKTATELVVMVTPEITTPLNKSDVKALPPMPKAFLPLALLGSTEGAAAPPAAPSKRK